MKRTTSKDFEVYEFRDEEQAELISNKILERLSGRARNFEEFQNPNEEDTSPLRKYQFVKFSSSSLTPRGKKMRNVSCIDVETNDNYHKCKDHGAHNLGKLEGGDSAVTEGTSGSDEIRASNSTIPREDAHTNPDTVGSEVPLPECPSVGSLGAAASVVIPSFGNPEVKCNLSVLPSANDPFNVISDDDESVSCSSDIKEDQDCLGSPVSDHYSSEEDHYAADEEMEDVNMAVTISPDYLIYKDLYFTDSALSFSSSCIKLEGVNANDSKQFFKSEWGIVDVMGIDCQWYAGVEIALVKLSLRQVTDPEANMTDETSGIEELKFSVCEPHWLDLQEKITSMDVRYENVWRVLFDSEMMEEDTSVGNKQICSEGYYPSFDDAFEDVIYPKGDPDAVSISKRDVELLQPETFINDTIIDFYIKYLKSKIGPEDRSRFHFFNSFFFRKLADLDKNPSSASEGRAAFLRVRKWTRKVNLFEKDYVLIPVNFNLHWSLLVICHPGEISSFKDEEVEKSLKVPCILHMDSIKGSHNGLKNLIQSYLWEEWKERQADPAEDVSPNFLNLRFVPLELPQQENSFDCGLFLLHYVELFLEDAPVCFNPFKLTDSSYFLRSDWFPPGEASLKRVDIQNLIYELLQDHSQENFTVVRDKECQSFQCMENNREKEKGSEFLSDGQDAGILCNGFSSCPNDEEGIEIKLLGTPAATQSLKGSSFVLKEFLEPGNMVGSVPDGDSQCVDHLASFYKLKDNEDKDEIAPSPSGLRLQPVGDVCTTSYSLKGPGVNNFDISMRQKVDDHDHSSSEAFGCGSESSAEVMIDEHDPVSEKGCLNRRQGTEMSKLIPSEYAIDSPGSGCSEGLDTRVVEDSQDVERVGDDVEEKKSNPSEENFAASSDHCQGHLDGNENNMDENPESRDDRCVSESFENQAAKRPRQTLGDETLVTGSFGEEWEV